MSAEPFSFDTEFDPSGQVVGGGRNSRRYRQAEVDELVAQARAEGEASAVARAAEAQSAAIADVAGRLAPVIPKLTETLTGMREQGVGLARTLAVQLAGEAMARFPTEKVDAVLRDGAGFLPEDLKLTVSVPEGLREAFAAELAQYVSERDISVVGDGDMPAGDWRISWQGGALGFDQAEAVKAVDELIARHLSEPVEAQGDLFADVA